MDSFGLAASRRGHRVPVQSSESFGHWHTWHPMLVQCRRGPSFDKSAGSQLQQMLCVVARRNGCHYHTSSYADRYKFRNIGGDDAHAIMKHLHGPISLLAVGPETWCIIVVDREASQKPHRTFFESLVFVDVEQSHCVNCITKSETAWASWNSAQRRLLTIDGLHIQVDLYIACVNINS